MDSIGCSAWASLRDAEQSLLPQQRTLYSFDMGQDVYWVKLRPVAKEFLWLLLVHGCQAYNMPVVNTVISPTSASWLKWAKSPCSPLAYCISQPCTSSSTALPAALH